MLRKSVRHAVALAMLSMGLGACVGTGGEPPSMRNANTGSIGTAVSSATAPSRNAAWSGASGASGHPEMRAETIRTAASQFSRCLESLWPQVARRGISRATFERHTAGLTPDLRLMDLMDSQPEFSKPIWDYLETLVSEERIAKGREMLATHRATFDAIERTYGVDRHVVAAIWGVETKFGAITGDRPVIRATATLACIGRRQDYFREEFLSALEILHRGDVRAEQFRGSWAGAFGPTQFMPTTFKRHAVDFDGDGRRDIVGSVADGMASTANYLKKEGWQTGQAWGYEVSVPRGFDYLLADRAREHTVGQWERLGVQRTGGRAFTRAGERAYLLMPAGARGPSFLMLGNFRVLMKYNPSESYALAIGHLADRMRGGDGFLRPWPRDEPVLSRTERLELQQRLAVRGFDVGETDGRLGTKTRVAIRQFQASAGLAPDGFASGTILTRLRTE